MSDASTVSRTRASAPSPAPALRLSFRSPRLWILLGLVLAIAALSQLVGPAVIPLGFAAITILPMVWGLLAGGVVSAQRVRRLPLDLQSAAAGIMTVAVLLLVARLSFTIGPNIGLLIEAGPALLLQEVGHLFGTILLALPLAVLLRMGPATVGATFSIDREGSFAMVSERYGTDSHQYRGVLSMYVFGTLFGAVLISLIASFATSLDIFDPLALAMGAGVGSGSMMAAAAASVAAAHPEMQEQVLAVAATSNVITGILGLYIGMYVALPLADRFYRVLTKRQRVVAEPVAAAPNTAAPKTAAPKTAAPKTAGTAPLVNVPLLTTLPALVVVGVVVSSIAAQSFSWNIVGGYLVLAALLAIGVGIARLTRGTVASMIGIVTLGALLSSPISPVAELLGTAVATIDFLSVCTVVLTVAGLSLGKDLPLLKSIGWKIAPVGIVSIAASYLLSVVVAEFALGFWN